MAQWTRAFDAGSYAANWRVTLDYVITEQDITNNRSYIELRNYVYATSSAYWTEGSWNGKISINGGVVSDNSPYARISNDWYLMNAWGGWVDHDGAGNLEIQVGNSIDSIVNNAYYKWFNWTLPSIPRHGNITAVSGNFNDTTTNPWIEFTNPAGGSTEVYFTLPNLTGTTRYAQRNGVGSRYTWTLTEAEKNALRDAMKNVKSTTVRYNYANYVGGWVTRTADRTLSIVDANPTFSTVSHKDINPATVAITGNDQYLIQGRSTLEAKVAVADKAVPQKYATMSKYVFNVAGVSSEATFSDVADVLKSMGTINQATNQTLTVTAVDSRTNQTSVTQNVNLVPYAKPVVTATAQRLNNFEATTTVNIGGSISLLSVLGANKNAVSALDGVQYRLRESGGTWGAWTAVASAINATTGAIEVSAFNLTLDNTKAFDMEFSVTDALDTTIVALTLPAGEAIFRISTHDELVYNKEHVLMRSHVGMIMMTATLATSASVAEIYGGTWVAWGTGRVPVGIDVGQTEFNTIEKTGGHKLLQQHTHTQDSHNHSQNSHNHAIRRDNSSGDAGFLPQGAAPQSIISYTGSNNSNMRGTFNDRGGTDYSNGGNLMSYTTATNNATTATNQNTGGGNSQNLQPYITVYMWKRTV